MISVRIFGLFLLFFSLSSFAASSSDLAREKYIAEKLTQRLKHGEVENIKSTRSTFFSLYTAQQSQEQAKGAVILVHGMGAHPDWPEVITFLRTALPQQGWSTLSIQMPILSPEDPIEGYGATSLEAGQRIKAAIKHLQDKEYDNIAVVAYSFGAATAVQFLAAENPGIKGLVGISMMAQPFLNPRLLLLEELADLKIPTLDVYGSQDRSEIVDAAADRRLAARKAENRFYKQIQIEGADHSFVGVEEVLGKRIRGWLDKLIVEFESIQDNSQ